AQLGAFQRNGADRDAVRPFLVEAIERGFQAVVGRFADMQEETEFRAGGVESALPVAGDVLRVCKARGQNECCHRNESLHNLLPALVSNSVRRRRCFRLSVARLLLKALELQRSSRSLAPVAGDGIAVFTDLALKISADL